MGANRTEHHKTRDFNLGGMIAAFAAFSFIIGATFSFDNAITVSAIAFLSLIGLALFTRIARFFTQQPKWGSRRLLAAVAVKQRFP